MGQAPPRLRPICSPTMWARSLSFVPGNSNPSPRYCSAALIPASTATYANSWRLASLTTQATTFDFVIGGGIDIPLTHSIAFRPAQVDYVFTRFGNGFTAGNQNQSNFRYQAGIQFRF